MRVRTFLVLVLIANWAFANALTVREARQPGDFALVADGKAAVIVVDAEDARVVQIAAACLADDIERVTGVKPRIEHAVPAGGGAAIVGSMQRSQIVREHVEGNNLQAKWESFECHVVGPNFVIAGSDRRGAAYGILELSRAIGVSPWNWWADVPPKRKSSLFVSPDPVHEGPPSVKYRGIFLNDEDFGLQPWAAKTFEPEAGDIGPKTYARIFELLLRLKANYCWPAMHDCTRAFNAFPQNKQVADDYAIVMGSSHCEQMLCNNVTEWPRDQHDKWNPVTNLPAIVDYWEKRVRENGKFESTWTVGMRGIHDGGMPGGGSIDEKRQRMEEIIALQRGLLARHVNPDPAEVPQIFCPYKEVLDIYRGGLKLPDDVTIVWPDDNFGYIRQLPDAKERKRAGGHGVYYHLSYWGRPHDYLWLPSIAPALIWHEMTKAHEFGASRFWVVNVGDIKPIEVGMTLFLELGWDVNRYGPDVTKRFLNDFFIEQFGAERAPAMADVMAEYFHLCSIRKPEHLGWNGTYPNTPVRGGEFTHFTAGDEAARRVEQCLALAQRAEAIEQALPEEQRAAYFQFVLYPVAASAAMNEKMICAEKSRILASLGIAGGAEELGERAQSAMLRIKQFTDRYNNLSGGKWRGMMDHQPRKLPVFADPVVGRVKSAATTAPSPATQPADDDTIAIDAVQFTRLSEQGPRWVPVEGLGRRGGSLVLLPRTSAAMRTAAEIQQRAPVAEYRIHVTRGGEANVIVETLPTQPIDSSHELLVAVSIDDGAPAVAEVDQANDERNRTWQGNVLRNAAFARTKLTIPLGDHVLKLWGADPSVGVQRITLDFGRMQPSYLGPKSISR